MQLTRRDLVNLICLSLTAPVLAAAGPAAQTSPVPVANAPAKQMYQQDAQHSGRSPFAGPSQANVLRRFDTSTPDNLPSDAIIPRDDFQSSGVVGADGTFYIANFPGVLFALRDDPSNSDRLALAWRFHPPAASSFHATPALSADGSTIYLGFASGGFNTPGGATLYALNTASSGPEAQVVWSVDLGATRVMSSPTVGPDGTIYLGTSGGQLFAVGADGTIRWTAQTGPTIKSAPALGLDGTIYLPSSDGKLYAVSPQGQLIWTFDFGQHLGPTPLVTSDQAGPGGAGGGSNGIGSGASPTIGPDGTIFIGADNSNMYAVTPDGNLRWLFEAERELAGIWTTPALSADGATIYFGANKGGVYAVSTADGSKRWQFPVYGSIYASSVLDNRGVLYTGTTIEHLYALNTATGEPVWDLDVHNQIWSAPSIRPDGTLIIADRGGLVQVIG
jgi:outer membrane protein assembly factor BamB